MNDAMKSAQVAEVAPLLLDREKLAKAMGLSQRTIATLMVRPQDPLPFVRIGRAVRFLPRKVDEWIERQGSGKAPNDSCVSGTIR